MTSGAVIEMLRMRDGKSGITLYGIYRDELVKERDAWRFGARRFHIVYVDTTAPPGQFFGGSPAA